MLFGCVYPNIHSSMDNSDHSECLSMLEENLKFAGILISKLQDILHVEGVTKLQRKIHQELEFLKKLKKNKIIMKNDLMCSNLRHLGAMVEFALKAEVKSVCKVFHIDENTKLAIDIVSDGGKIWTKVIARNPKSLDAQRSNIMLYGKRTIVDQAIDYLQCAQLYPYMYQPPKVVFEFTRGVEFAVAQKLTALGVIVNGEVLTEDTLTENCSNSDSDWSEEDSICDSVVSPRHNQTEEKELAVLNLDVTAMMAYVSNMTNGHCNYVFKQEVLTQQSQWETERPVKPVLEKLFKGKSLVCCKTAWDDFEKIVSILGGSQEKQRTEELKKLVKVFPDDHGGEDDYPRKILKVRGHVRLRSKIVFNFGHRIKALTVSANEGFMRAAQQQGVTYTAFIHESRALTEGKEATATKTLL